MKGRRDLVIFCILLIAAIVALHYNELVGYCLGWAALYFANRLERQLLKRIIKIQDKQIDEMIGIAKKGVEINHDAAVFIGAMVQEVIRLRAAQDDGDWWKAEQ